MPALAERGLSEAPRLVQPMPFSTLLWRVTVLGEQQRLEIVTGVLDNGEHAARRREPHQRVGDGEERACWARGARPGGGVLCCAPRGGRQRE